MAEQEGEGSQQLAASGSLTGCAEPVFDFARHTPGARYQRSFGADLHNSARTATFGHTMR
jgi:hypothetical protein